MLKKRYIKSRKVWKVTFEVPKSEMPEANGARSVNVVGEFNGWDPTATPMTRAKGGLFRATVELAPGQTQQFRYLVDGERWYYEWHADGYVPGRWGLDTCLVVAPPRPVDRRRH